MEQQPWKHIGIFDPEEREIFKEIKLLKRKLNALYKKNSQKPCSDLMIEIQKIESEIIQKGYALYPGHNINYFLSESIEESLPEDNFNDEVKPDNKGQFTIEFPDQENKNHLNSNMSVQYSFEFPEPPKQNTELKIPPRKIQANPPKEKPEHFNFSEINSYFTGAVLIDFLERFLPGGKTSGHYYIRASLYPNDTKKGKSFRYNTATGKFSDFAAGQSGCGVMSLVMFAKDLNPKNYQDLKTAAKFLSDWANKPFNNDRFEPLPPVKKRKLSSYMVPPIGTPPPDTVCLDGKLVKPDAIWPYMDKFGRPVTYDCRINFPDGSKVVLPVKWQKHRGVYKWVTGAIPNFRPISNLHIIDNFEIVFISEGRKTSNAVEDYVKDIAVSVTWQGGTNAVRKTDWTSIKNKKIIIIIPDADRKFAMRDIKKLNIKKGDLLPWELQPGQKAALEIAEIVSNLNENVYIVNTEGKSKIKDGWDTDDAKLEGWTKEEFFNFIISNIQRYIRKESEKQYV